MAQDEPMPESEFAGDDSVDESSMTKTLLPLLNHPPTPNQLRIAKILDSMNAEDQQKFDEIVRKKAAELNIASHPSTKRMAMAILAYGNSESEPAPQGNIAFKLSDVPSGIKPTGDPKVDDALKILRMINIYRYRNLQTEVNEHLASLQELTADPKVDTAMGKVGR